MVEPSLAVKNIPTSTTAIDCIGKPSLTIENTSKLWLVNVSLPFFYKDEIHVKLVDCNTIRLHASHKERDGIKGRDFQHKYTVPDYYDPKTVEYKFDKIHGLLTISAKAKSKKDRKHREDKHKKLTEKGQEKRK